MSNQHPRAVCQPSYLFSLEAGPAALPAAGTTLGGQRTRADGRFRGANEVGCVLIMSCREWKSTETFEQGPSLRGVFPVPPNLRSLPDRCAGVPQRLVISEPSI